jgi:DNA-binding protein Fis
MAYPWPGNVRQLENAIERAVALSGGRTQIETSDLTPDIQQASQTAAAPDVNLPEGGIDFDRYINRIEHDLIRRALEKTGGNKGRHRGLLNLKRTTLVEKLKRLEPRAARNRGRSRRLFRPKAGLSEQDRQEMLDALRAAATGIPSVRRFHVGSRVTHGAPHERLVTQDFPLLPSSSSTILPGFGALEHPQHEKLGALFYRFQEMAVAYDYEVVRP